MERFAKIVDALQFIVIHLRCLNTTEYNSKRTKCFTMIFIKTCFSLSFVFSVQAKNKVYILNRVLTCQQRNSTYLLNTSRFLKSALFVVLLSCTFCCTKCLYILLEILLHFSIKFYLQVKYNMLYIKIHQFYVKYRTTLSF